MPRHFRICFEDPRPVAEDCRVRAYVRVQAIDHFNQFLMVAVDKCVAYCEIAGPSEICHFIFLLGLKKEPQEINLGQVVRNTEPDFKMVECFEPKDNKCIHMPLCELHNVLRQATEAYFKVLDSVTLAHLLQRDNRLRKLIQIQIHPPVKTK